MTSTECHFRLRHLWIWEMETSVERFTVLGLGHTSHSRWLCPACPGCRCCSSPATPPPPHHPPDSHCPAPSGPLIVLKELILYTHISLLSPGRVTRDFLAVENLTDSQNRQREVSNNVNTCTHHSPVTSDHQHNFQDKLNRQQTSYDDNVRKYLFLIVRQSNGVCPFITFFFNFF